MENDFLWDLVKVMAGALGSGLLLYFKVVRQVAHVEGKLDILVNMMKLAEENREKVGEVKAYAVKNRQDMNHYFTRLRKAEESIEEIQRSGHA